MVTPLILAGLGALASGALSGSAAAGVEAIVDAAKNRGPPPPPIRARGFGTLGKIPRIKRKYIRRGTGLLKRLSQMKHKRLKKRGGGLKGKRGSYWGRRGSGSLNIGAYPMITRPVHPLT